MPDPYVSTDFLRNTAVVNVSATSLNLSGQAEGKALVTYGVTAPEAPLSYQQITNAQLAAVQAMTVPAGANRAVVQNNGSQPARWRHDGVITAPTASTGQRVPAGEALDLRIGFDALVSARFIREGDGATLDIVFYR